MTWENTYPTVAMVKSASMVTLQIWDSELPAPQTDVERAVRARIERRLLELATQELRKKAPELADNWNELSDRLKKFGLDHLIPKC